MRPTRTCATAAVLMGFLSATAMAAGVALPDPSLDDAPAAHRGSATLVLAGGCFWGIEEVFQHVRGTRRR